jgi:hypothetical protein
MSLISCKFHQSWRGPNPGDHDIWSLVFDQESRRLLVRHEWHASQHSGFEDLEVTEFLQQSGSAQAALVDNLFLVPADS